MNKYVVVNFEDESVMFFNEFKEIEDYISEYISDRDIFDNEEVNEIINDFNIYTIPEGEQYFPTVSISREISVS